MKDHEHKHRAEHIAREAGLDMSERVEMVRELFPEAVAEGKVDWDKLDDLRPVEKHKIKYGEQHFASGLRVDYTVITSAAEI